MISISVVSHGQGTLVLQLLSDLTSVSHEASFEVILTKNIPEQFPFAVDEYPFSISVIENSAPKGFGANHNQAFMRALGTYFCVVNPDIRMAENPFPKLLSVLENKNVGIVAPQVVDPGGSLEDSVRRFPTLLSLVAKLFRINDGRYSVPQDGKPYSADWVGGMFMLFRSDNYRLLKGFDESYFLYYEDVDICTRMWKTGRRVVANPEVLVIHDARRTSRHSLRYIMWHIESMLRYLIKHCWCLPRTSR
ncbi:MAG: glycosyltransferase family 2 protein [Methylomonas sp.]|jgi:hypothetical protein|uniref:glycosyltransferase n=1 Tax=Methylomonas sp. TaxID=418 RepID=UPI0025D7702B|nr:glycosyltransferase family 2 protein [Methylomonas sp.]MCK9607880.1 glycosyltransferase family 2 protein [Methylomonas sp.]